MDTKKNIVTSLVGVENSIDKEDRIYDSLAKVLSPGSECIAVALLSDVIYVAANEVDSGGNQAGAPASLKDLKKYIQDKFIDEKERKQRTSLKDYAIKICSHKNLKFCFKQNSKPYTTNIHKQAVNIAFNSQTQTIHYLALKRNPKIGYNAPLVAYGATEILQNIENLKKVKQYCNEEKEFCSKINGMEWAYNARNQYSKIQKQKEKYFYPKVHAEMKILAEIIKQAKSGNLKDIEIYIGITKSCCFHCHHTLEAASEILKKEYGITLIYRAHHDISFAGDKFMLKPEKKDYKGKTKEFQKAKKQYKKYKDLRCNPPVDKWAFPFEDPKNAKDIHTQIIENASELFKVNLPSSDTEMLHKLASQSSASPDSSFEDAVTLKVEEYIYSLKETQLSFNNILKLVGSSKNLKGQIEAVALIIDLYEIFPKILIESLDESVAAQLDHILNLFNNASTLLGIDTDEEKIKLLCILKGDFAHAKMKEFFKSLQENMIVTEERKDNNVGLIYSPEEKSDSGSPRASRKVKRAEFDIGDNPIPDKKAKVEHQSQDTNYIATISTAQPLLPNFNSSQNRLGSPSDSEEEENKKLKNTHHRKTADRP